MDDSGDVSADNAIDGNASPADYDYLTDGSLAASQNAYDASTDGTLNNATTGTGTAPSAGTVTPPAGGSSYTPPAYLTQLAALSSNPTITNAATAIAGIINGQQAVSPAAAGQPGPAPGQATVQTPTAPSSNTTLLVLGALGIGALVLLL